MPKKIIFLFIFLIIANMVSWFFVFNSENYLEIDFFDVGQGDAIFIETKEGHQILIDGGPDDTVMAKLEKEMGIFDKTIDLVILTHPDDDHFSGLIGVLETYEVDNFIWTGEEKDSENFKKLKNQFEDINVLNVFAGDKITAGDVVLEIFNPEKDYEDLTSNDTSIVLKLTHIDARFMLTGDLTSKLEPKIIKAYDLGSDVLKLGHHGSKHSSSDIFLKTVSPKYAIASVGKDNSFGHPGEEVIKRLEDNGINFLRTDRDGDIKFYSNGYHILFEREKK